MASNMDDPSKTEVFVGILDVCIHQATDIHNICIYQEQDVYAKLSLSDKPETKIESQIINGGGRNPVFNETVKLQLRTLESSIRFEVWMLSRIRNYLEDQFLGFVSVPICDVVSDNGKVRREFQLSSNDIVHSPAGNIELSFKYTSLPSDAKVSCQKASNGTNVLDSVPNVDTDVPVNVCTGLERQVVQEEIVDMYMKSMKQFTDALAKMHLPVGDGSTGGKNKDKSEESGPEESVGPSQKVFYGSRAFF